MHERRSNRVRGSRSRRPRQQRSLGAAEGHPAQTTETGPPNVVLKDIGVSRRDAAHKACKPS
jgi:hypothetical protein